MPQSPTPNMQLVLPDDHGSSDVWDTILDTAFGLIDQHDHSTGKGVKVPSAGLNIDADFSAAVHSITNLMAVDFTPVATSAITGYSSALFTNSADNNLYWRNSVGTNVQLTSGSTLNVAAFAGGIGGDYSAAGALEIFDDATDSYWFQQQVGNSVRQYARMRSADIDLYEFKAHPTAGVPANRIRLASPASLAASYALTLPGALPSLASTSKTMAVTSTGAMSFGPASPITIHAASFLAANNYATGTLTLGTSGWTFGAAPPNDTVIAALVLPTGTTIVSLQWFFNKNSSSSPLTMTLQTRNGATNTIRDTLADVTNGAGQVSVTRAPNYSTVAGDAVFLQVQAGGAVMSFSHVIVTLA